MTDESPDDLIAHLEAMQPSGATTAQAPPGMRIARAREYMGPPIKTGDKRVDSDNMRTYRSATFIVPDDSARGLLEWEDRAACLPAIQADAEQRFFAAHPEMAAMFQKPKVPVERAMPEMDIVYRPLKRGR